MIRITPSVAALALLVLVPLAACSSGTEAEHAHGGHASSGHATEPAGHCSACAATESTADAPSLTAVQPSPDYPLSTCVVSGDALDAMGGPAAFEYGGEEIQFCCKGCVRQFEESPDEFLSKVRAATK